MKNLDKLDTRTQIIILLDRALKDGITVFLENGEAKLKVSKKKNLDQELIADLKRYKPEITAFLIKEASNFAKANNSQELIEPFDRTTVDKIPLSFAQERLWFVDQMNGSTAYHIPVVVKLKGNLNRAAFEQAFLEIIDQHEILRTLIQAEEGIPFQKIHHREAWTIQFLAGKNNSEAELAHQIETLIALPFDLSVDLPIRVSLIESAEAEHVLVVVMHHIASDGWSNSVMMNEFIQRYNAILNDRPANIPPLKIQYADFACWQRLDKEEDTISKQLNYWKNHLQNISPLELPIDFPRPAIQSVRGDVCDFTLSKTTNNQLQTLANQQGTSLFMVLLSAFKVLLYRYTGNPDICISSTIAGRNKKEIEPLIGFFINTLPLRSTLNGKLTFSSFLQQVKDTTLEAYAHQDVPFEQIVEGVGVQRDMSRSPISQVMFNFLNLPGGEGEGVQDLEIESFYETSISVKRDLTISIHKELDQLEMRMSYCRDLFEKETIARMLNHYANILEAIAANPHQKIEELQLLDEAERTLLLKDFGTNKYDGPVDQTLVSLFEKQVQLFPDYTALVLGAA